MIDTKKSRGRPRKLDKTAATQAAMALFWQKGYDAVGITELTGALGVKPPSLYAMFGNKAGVLEAAMESYHVLVGDTFAPAFDAKTPDAFLDAFLQCAVTSYTAHDGKGCLVLDGTRNATDPDAITLSNQQRDAFAATLRTKLSELGVAKPDDMTKACVVAMTGLSGCARMGMPADALSKSAHLLAAGILTDLAEA